MVAQVINLGSTQAPYWELTETLKAGERRKINYVTDSFHLLDVSAPNALKVNFGGSMIDTPFTSGLGYHLTQPVEFIELINESGASLTVHFAIGIGDIRDNRLTVSGTVLTQTVGYSKLIGGTKSTTETFTAGNGMFDIMVTAGSVTIGVSGGNYNVSGLVLPEGASWNVELSESATITVTPAASSTYNYTIAQY